MNTNYSFQNSLDEFNRRFDRDECGLMTDDEFGDWLNRLPRSEFLAACEEYGSKSVSWRIN